MSEFTSVTRCPYCKTSFHLGPMQLDAAGGKVRCGACLNIFDAREHFLVEQKHLFDSLPPAPAEPEPAPEPAPAYKPTSFYLYEEDPAPPQPPEAELLEADVDEAELDDAGPYEDIYPVMTEASMATRPPSRWWLPLALVGTLLLPVQAFWWQPPALLEQPWYQSFLRANCDWLPCAHTRFHDPNYLSLNGLIQPSTTHQQVLTALIELRNQAPLPQPFPALSVRFMNLGGELVSARVFDPSEYLQNEASGRRLIQADQRVQIELQIYDPGREAVSYEFAPLYLGNL